MEGHWITYLKFHMGLYYNLMENIDFQTKMSYVGLKYQFWYLLCQAIDRK